MGPGGVAGRIHDVSNGHPRFSFVAAAFFTSGAYGQPSGIPECGADPYTIRCSEECYVCVWDTDCEQWHIWTAAVMSPGCVDDECTPDWNESSRVNGGVD